MANTTYSEIWDKFISICKVDEYDIPQTTQGRRLLVSSGVDIYNEKMDESLLVDNNTDEVLAELDTKRINLIAQCMKLQVCMDMYSDYTSTYSMYQKEVGIKDYNAQANARQTLISMQEDRVNSIAFSLRDDFEG